MARRTRQVSGSVDYDQLGKPAPELMRWRKLYNEKTKTFIRVFAYSVRPPNIGPWSGYDAELLPQAPCSHCGRTGNGTKLHVCPGDLGRNSEGTLVKCYHEGNTNDEGGHVCVGHPSMCWHGIKRWRPDEGWKEV